MPHLPTLLIQIGVILIVARLVGLLFRKIHQPQVMGEMVAGILLGPSLLGTIAPGISTALFPEESLGFLNSISQIGLILFMFLIGLELEPKILKGNGKAAAVISNVSIAVPFFFGTLLAVYLYPRLSDDGVAFTHFALFIGTAMSITAFPVLARILLERKLLTSRMGTLAVASAAIGDVTGWIILAAVVLLVRTSEAPLPLWGTLAGVVVYISIMVILIRRWFTRFERDFLNRGSFTQDALAILLLFVLASSWVTEWLGIHALFGAFLAGAILPKHPKFIQTLTEKLNDVAVVLLLPLFFAFTGLRTSIGLVSGIEMWFYTFLILAVAVAGKFGGTSIAAKASGLPWREAGALGILMNTRGLMELVVLNIGLDIGVLSPALFTMMVIMALTTTFMTAPFLEWIYYSRILPKDNAPQVQDVQFAQVTMKQAEANDFPPTNFDVN
jgi:Kef-type K+ transport system membrane component KefB